MKATGSSTAVPNNCKAKLMYYLSCLCGCVEAESDPFSRRFTDYKNNYSSLSYEEEGRLLDLCSTLSPDKLTGIFIPAGNSDIGAQNEFFELSAVDTKLLVTESFAIGGQQRRVCKIMMYKDSWIENYYYDPLRALRRERTQRVNRPPPRREYPLRSYGAVDRPARSEGSIILTVKRL